MGDVTVFYSGEVEAEIDICLDLALIYKCDPFVFFNQPSHAIELLQRKTIVRLRMMQEP